MALDLNNPVVEDAPKPPPARKRPTPGTKSPGRPRKTTPAKTQERQEGIQGIFQLAAFGFTMARQIPDARACADHGPNISREVALLAEKNSSVAEVVDFITAAGPYAGLLAAVIPFGLQIMVNHNRIPAAPLVDFGIKDPRVLEAEFIASAEAARQEAEQAIAEAQQAAHDV